MQLYNNPEKAFPTEFYLNCSKLNTIGAKTNEAQFFNFWLVSFSTRKFYIIIEIFDEIETI
jgi:hypothetical protein